MTHSLFAVHLAGGTASQCAYFPDTSAGARGIMLPKAFGAAIERARHSAAQPSRAQAGARCEGRTCMAELTYEAVIAARRRIEGGETDIESEARHHTLGELADALRMTRGMLQAIVQGWSDAQLNIQPPAGRTTDPASQPRGELIGEDRWSASEAITHLIATENWYLLHMTRLLGRREHFDLLPRGLGDQARHGVPGMELATELRKATDLLLTEIDAIPPTADLAATRSSTYFGDLSLRGWVMLAIVHDLQHFEQIQRLVDLPDFPTT